MKESKKAKVRVQSGKNKTTSKDISNETGIQLAEDMIVENVDENVADLEEEAESPSNCNIDDHEENDHSEDDDESTEEVWDLKKIMSIAAVTNKSPIKCSHETCTLAAAAVWVSSLKPSENWYSCLDCQENDFDGWPDLEDLPIKFMTKEHKEALITHCSKYKDCAMPNFESSPIKDGCVTENPTITNTITPPPVFGYVEPTQGKCSAIQNTVTPNQNGAEIDSNNVPKKKVSGECKPSKAQLEIHRKWQAAAEAAGGPNARIVISKVAAKKMIFDWLFDAFRPVTISDIHKGLKALVPSPVLKACLDDMALDNDYHTQFVESDNEDTVAKTTMTNKSADTADYQFKNSLSYKGGKGSSSGLYYVNYTEAIGGRGLGRDEQNQLAADVSTAQEKFSSLKYSITQSRAMTTKLLSEPINSDLHVQLKVAESELIELSDKLEAARMLKVNEKHKIQTKKRIDHLASFWRKRRKLCMDFLIVMEEITDGAVSAKTCLSGTGQIEIDSDEACSKQAIEFGKKKRNRSINGKVLVVKKKSTSDNTGLQPSENFVAVMLDNQGIVQRVFLDDRILL